MRTNARSVPALASALLLAASAATVSCCYKPSPKKIHDLSNRAVAVNVIIVYNPATKMGEFLAPSDKTIELSFQFRDFAQWASPDGLVHIVRWSTESPFDKDPAHARKVLISGPPKKAPKDPAGDSFDYTAELELFDAAHTRVAVVDPRIVIMP